MGVFYYHIEFYIYSFLLLVDTVLLKLENNLLNHEK